MTVQETINAGQSLQRTVLAVPGAHCAGCIAKIEHGLPDVPGIVSARLNIFLNLYGFCRNMTMALVLAAATLTVGIVAGTAEAGSHVEPAWWIAAALIAAVGLFYRYLKFLRQYAVELLTSYAATDLTAPQQH